jgi:hypothetical protein
MAKLEESTVLPRVLLALLQTNKLWARFLPRELMCTLSLLSTPEPLGVQKSKTKKLVEKEGSQREQYLDSNEVPEKHIL